MFVVFTVSAQMIVGFLLAMLFAKQFPLRKYLLILVLTPMMLSVVASGVFFTYYYDPTFGILSYVDQQHHRRPVHPDGQQGRAPWPASFLPMPGCGRPSSCCWCWRASSRCRNISTRRPPSTGSPPGGSFWTITFPYIRGLLMLALLFRTIEAFKLADLVILLTKGGNDTMTISYHLIRIANEQNKTSEGAAISYRHAVHGDRAHQPLSLPRQPPEPGSLTHGRHISIWERLGFRRASGVGEAGWGRTLVVAIVASSTSCRCSSSSSPPSSRRSWRFRCRRRFRPPRSSASFPTSLSSRRRWRISARSSPAS